MDISKYVRQEGDPFESPNGRDLGTRPAQIQVSFTYHTAILVSEETGKNWPNLTDQQRTEILYNLGFDPKNQFAEGAIDESDPAKVEFLDCESYEVWNAE